jgi:hypothetical protein
MGKNDAKFESIKMYSYLPFFAKMYLQHDFTRVKINMGNRGMRFLRKVQKVRMVDMNSLNLS